METVICILCNTDCSTHYFMCDQDTAPSAYCPECFVKTPCGKGQHEEDCPTQVFQDEEGHHDAA